MYPVPEMGYTTLTINRPEAKMAKYTFDLDFSYETGLDALIREITPNLHGGRIKYVVPEGPGGGNPMFVFEFEELEAVRKFHEWYCAGDDSELEWYVDRATNPDHRG